MSWTRVFFPAVYVAFALPLIFATPLSFAFAAASCMALAAALNRRLFLALMPLVATSLLTFVLLLGLVQAAVCSSGLEGRYANLGVCLAARMPPTFLGVALLAALMLLAACNERRASLVDTINGLCLPRQIRLMATVAAAMVGEFRKAFMRVHHAATARGDASPGLRLGNVTTLPRILACTWAAVLTGAGGRLAEQWASDVFWNRYVPRHVEAAGAQRDLRRDAAVLVAAIIIVVAAALLTLGGS
jgi:hypothetical protein